MMTRLVGEVDISYVEKLNEGRVESCACHHRCGYDLSLVGHKTPNVWSFFFFWSFKFYLFNNTLHTSAAGVSVSCRHVARSWAASWAVKKSLTAQLVATELTAATWYASTWPHTEKPGGKPSVFARGGRKHPDGCEQWWRWCCAFAVCGIALPTHLSSAGLNPGLQSWHW